MSPGETEILLPQAAEWNSDLAVKVRWGRGVGRCTGHQSLWQKQSKILPDFLAFLDPNSLKPKSIGKLWGKKNQTKPKLFGTCH